MKRYILTGAPGAGKTTIIRELEATGYSVVHEAATDMIAVEHARGNDEPWTHPAFIDAIAYEQQQRELRASAVPVNIQFFDRSPICTYALCTFLRYPISQMLGSELARIQKERVYERSVFFIRNLGYIVPTAARRISFEDSLVFEKAHEDAYREFGYTLVSVEAAPLADRVALIHATVTGLEAAT